MEQQAKIRTVREFGGEIWAELSYAYRDDVDWETLQSISETIMAVLARHVGSTLMNDEGLPVTPLPPSR